jgi:alkanesulfonate monooxygenase SsuD/methylene tetrahydromethanopterin reductase-like flavin-dependent oxidoreductase (luciferase family)
VYVDVLFDPFEASWGDVRAGAIAAEAVGLGGIWLYDHLAGSVHRASRVLECWTTLTAIAVAVPRISVGSMVLNVANRDPGTLAVMAATLQEVSGGRLLLGLGAGGGTDTPYAAEQLALGRSVPAAPLRRRWVEDAVTRVRGVWTGAAGGASGFLRPSPPPPVIIGGFGPKMAELAGRVGDGINVPGGPRMGRLLEVAHRAHEQAGRDPADFIVTASAGPRDLDRLAGLGVSRAVVFVRPPYVADVERLGAHLS